MVDKMLKDTVSTGFVETPPLVSIITPAYNSSRYLTRALESVKRQDFSLEHIIVDDCSSDSSWLQLQALQVEYPWVKTIRLENNCGPVVARNKAIEISKGRFLAFHDVDDFWLPNKLKTQIQFMVDNDCALSFSDYRFVSEDGRYVGRRLNGFDKIGWNLHHITRYLGCLTIVLDKNKISDFIFPNINPAIRAEDFLAWSYCIKKTGAALRCPHDLARYAVVPNSRSSKPISVSFSIWKLYRNVEDISIFMSALYFICYSFVVAWKRFWYRPRFDRTEVDRDYEWSLLPETELRRGI